MARYLAVYKGTANEISSFHTSSYDLNGFVEFDSKERDYDKLKRLADDAIRGEMKGRFAPIWSIERLVEVAKVIK
jgi:hypothetical protein